MQIRQLGKAVAVVGVLVGLNACASIPQRAWDNGRNVSSSRAYRSMMRGDRSFQTARQLYSTMDPYRSLYEPLPYPYFGRW
jgi:hypothetical protein